ncbi:MAG: 3-hydroxyacyl-CoA dehydrogenase NAD-binding domain-containing protein [Flavobacteriaceae bacterium]|jgi:3-hydroxybutyryl-CoA dehydrogenase|nr:3-hydroxyacyl-CoA dehydrogenase NAD-binding domain-containing protein [Flavobacteriaceae bacterium]
MKNITVVGSGTMGSGIAHCFAQYGYNVNLVDLSKEALALAMVKIENNLDRQLKKEVLTVEEKTATLDRISLFTELKEAIKIADLVVEAVAEDQAVKAKIFAQLDAHAPQDCILATNTSSLSITTIAAFTKRPEKVIGMHFMNPVPVMRLVEIIKGHQTSKNTVETIISLTEQIEKVPLVAADYPGFVANRILLPMINEAIEALFQGVAEVEAIDEMMKLGMGHPMGPLRLADFIGLDVCLSVLEVLHQGFGKDKYAPCPLLRNLVAAGNLGVKTKRGFYDYSDNPKQPIPLQF